jgi:hypothetical protein
MFVEFLYSCSFVSSGRKGYWKKGIQCAERESLTWFVAPPPSVLP